MLKKVLIASDIHGNSTNFEKVYQAFYNEGCDMMILLGDIFTSSYSKSSYDVDIEKMLNKLANNLIIVKGNCDGELAYDASPVGLLNVYEFKIGNKNIICYHGHIDYSQLLGYDIYLHGHSHHFLFEKDDDGKIFLNPGSVGFPRDGTIGTYMILSRKHVTVLDIDNNVILEENI